MAAISQPFALLTGDSVALRVLRDYVHRVAADLGVGPESTYCEVDSPANAYVALENQQPREGQPDMALLWDERYGWAAAMETSSGEDLLVLAYFGDDPLPAPPAVVAFAERVLAGEPAGRLDPPSFHLHDVAARLARHATDLS